MISETAIETLEEMRARGLNPTVRDIIRLNALGLRLEAVRGKRVDQSTYLLPRVAVVAMPSEVGSRVPRDREGTAVGSRVPRDREGTAVGSRVPRDRVTSVAFRQPTVGHEIWLARAERWVASGDYQTLLALNCYALSRPWNELPDPDEPSVLTAAVAPYVETLKPYTRDQLYAAVRYALYGSDPRVGETAAHPKDTADKPTEDRFDECVAVGVLNEGRAVLFGITEADMKSMTFGELSAVIRSAYALHHMSADGEASRLEADYYATADEIERRLRAEASHPVSAEARASRSTNEVPTHG